MTHFSFRRSVPTDAVVTLLLFCVFTLCVLLVLITGAGVYKSTVYVMRERYESRTALAYLATVVRSHDSDKGAWLGEIDGIPALILSDNYGGVEYLTYIYNSNGYINELFIRAESDADADAGEKIIECPSIIFSAGENGLITADCGGKTMYIALRSAEGGGIT